MIMDEQLNPLILQFLDDESKFHYLEYYYTTMLNETGDEDYYDKLSCLHQWREEEEPIWQHRAWYGDRADDVSETDDDNNDYDSE
jgi:hypothetical protein